MNNLFRISQDNLENYFNQNKQHEHHKNIKLNNNNTKTTKIHKNNSNNANNANNANNLNYLNIHTNFKLQNKENNYVKNLINTETDNNNNNNNNKNNKYFNSNYNYDEFKNIEIIHNLNKNENENKYLYRNKDNENIFLIKNNFSQHNKIFSDKNISNINNNIKNRENKTNDKLLWEFGKSGIKLTKLKKPMIRNLAILFYIHNIFAEFVHKYKFVNLSNISVQLKNISNNIDKPIYSNPNGYLNLLNNSIYIGLGKEKIKGLYKFIDCGYVKLYDLDSSFNEDYLKKNKIPGFDFFLSYSDNPKHISKILKIFNNTNLFKIKSNSSNSEFDWTNLTNSFLPEILFDINEKKNIFDSDINKNFSFYIKVYETHSKAFVIDKNTKMIYYINTVENNKKMHGYLFYYVLQLDSNYNIVNCSVPNIIQENHQNIIQENSENLQNVKN